MVLKIAFVAAVCGIVLAPSMAQADEYRAGEFLGLDLSKAVLSPKRLGPETQFAPVPIEAKAETRADRTPDAEASATPGIRSRGEVRAARAAAKPERAPARARLARRHGNPLDAQARDTRIQTWPCRSGGICNWQR